jgi:hypothetical protein
MSDNDDFDFRRFRWLLVFGLILAGSCVFSLFDLGFLLFGRDGTATVTKTWESRSRRRTTIMVKYSFKEPDGYERTGETNEHSFDLVPAEGEEFAIQYLPRWMLESPDSSRPARGFNWITLGILLISGAGAAFFVYRAIYPADDSAPRKPPSRRR